MSDILQFLKTNYSNEDLFFVNHHSSLSGKVLLLGFPSCTCQITRCKFPGLVLALTSLAWSRDSRPKQEILDDLLEQARQVRSGQKAWGDFLSVHQARQHQENDSLDHQQQQQAEENANEDVSFRQSYCWDRIYVQFLPEAILSEAIF